MFFQKYESCATSQHNFHFFEIRMFENYMFKQILKLIKCIYFQKNSKDHSDDIFFTGNPTLVTEEYRKVCELQLSSLSERYAYVRSDYG